MKTLSPIQLR